MKEPSPTLERVILRGGYLTAAALLIRRLALLIVSGWSAWASPGSLLHTALDIVAAAALILVIGPLRRGGAPPLKRTIYVLAVVVIKLSWSIYDIAAVEPLFAVFDVAIATAAVTAALGAWRLTVWRRDYAVEDDEDRAEPSEGAVDE